MSTTLKALGLALLAALALSAVAAGSASAETSAGPELFHATEHTFQKEPLVNKTGNAIDHVILDGEEEGHQTFIAPNKDPEKESGIVTCANLEVHGTIFAPEEEHKETEEVTTTGTTEKATIEPTYSECTVSGEPGEFNAHVEFGECHYLFTSKLEEETKHHKVHVECPEGQEIQVKATFLGFKIACIAIPGQTPTGGGVTYINGETKVGEINTDDITVEATVEGIEYTTHKNCGGEAEGFETFNNATYEGDAVVWGTDTEEEKVDIWWN